MRLPVGILLADLTAIFQLVLLLGLSYSAVGCGGQIASDAGRPMDGGSQHVPKTTVLQDAACRGATGTSDGTTIVTTEEDSGSSSEMIGCQGDRSANFDSGAYCENCVSEHGTCCPGQCINPYSDQLNCGSCGNQCTGLMPYCNQGRCDPAPCSAACDSGVCCGRSCCGADQHCCATLGNFDWTFACKPTGEACPLPCYPFCM